MACSFTCAMPGIISITHRPGGVTPFRKAQGRRAGCHRDGRQVSSGTRRRKACSKLHYCLTSVVYAKSNRHRKRSPGEGGGSCKFAAVARASPSPGGRPGERQRRNDDFTMTSMTKILVAKSRPRASNWNN
jgi:hypothetical protein